MKHDETLRNGLAQHLRWLLAILLMALMTAPSRLIAQAKTFDHSALDALLRAHVVDGLVDYDAFASSAEFPRYLSRLAAFDPAALARDEQLAFWIDAYNAYTIQLINTHHERESIRNINKSFGFLKTAGAWKEKLAVVGGHAYSLDDIEHDIIRKRFNEPRIHFAVVCAAMGCPPLRGEAYVGARLNEQLDLQGRVFIVHSPAKNRVDLSTRTVYLSPIFVGFRNYIKDFGGSEAAVGKFIARYFPAGPERELLLSGDFKVETTNYDWTLNSQANAKRGNDAR